MAPALQPHPSRTKVGGANERRVAEWGETMASDPAWALAGLQDLRLRLEAAQQIIRTLRATSASYISLDMLDEWGDYMRDILTEMDEQDMEELLPENERADQVPKLRAELVELQRMNTSHLTPMERTARSDRLAHLTDLLHAYRHARPRAARPGQPAGED